MLQQSLLETQAALLAVHNPKKCLLGCWQFLSVLHLIITPPMLLQDIVPKAPKFFIMYKRAGYRVIINHSGDMIVRPSAVEASIHVAGALLCISISV